MASTETQTPDQSGDGDDLRGYIIASVIPCMVLGFVALALRLLSRRIKYSALMVSDYLAISGFLCSWVISLIIISEAKLGLGLHISQVPFANIRLILLTTFIGELFYSIGFTVIKLSILMLYRQLFPTRLILVSTTALAVFVILWGIALLLVSIFSCEPIHGFWDIDIPSKCVDSKWFFVGNAIPNILADLFLLFLPMRDVWKLKMSIQSKIGVTGLFALGSFVIIASGLRIKFTLSINPQDVTWDYVGVGLWTAVEINVAVISCCLPTVRPAVSLIVPERLKRIFTGTQTHRTAGSQGYGLRSPHNRQHLGSHDDIHGSQTDDFVPLK
ncbi:putative integral membrane protein [Rosellinia necatrix]|uniref:Putative integral membrane protein n=1 Tax=Rosellinia necatrix TaxID=77044 RepID=A0A1W2TNF6_ROSNE|nr:putative integral membrane protein [Rosellinia necatrix]